MRLISLESIMEEPLAPVEWLVGPFIGLGNRVVLFGEYSAFKSWTLLHLALTIAAGRPWLDRFPVPSPRRILYVDEEMNPRTLRRRVKQLATNGESSD